MGKSDVYMKRWLSNKERFADLINGSLFHGKQIFSGDSLRAEDKEQRMTQLHVLRCVNNCALVPDADSVC